MKSFTPRPYQTLIKERILKQPRCAVWSFMGSGKTAATLSALDILLPLEDTKVLIVAPPLVAKDVWPGEVEKWEELSHLKISAIVGDLSARLKALNTPADIYTTNFEQLPWLTEHFGKDWPFGIVVVDESSKLRGFRGSFQRSRKGTPFLRVGGGKRTAALAKIAFSKVKRFIELTGTPAPNGLKNLWGQIWYLDGGKRLGNSYSAFSQRWFTQSWNGFDIIPLPTADKEIRERVADITFALKASDWFDLKKPIVTNVFVDLPPKALANYKSMEKEFYTEIRGKGVEAVNAGGRDIRLSQIANGAIYTDEKKNFEVIHDEKIKALESIIEEAEGMPILVVYVFKHDLAVLKKAFPKGKALDKDRQTVKDWNSGKIPLMFLHAASAGHGNNFQDGGNIIVFYGIDWDLELYAQVNERIGPARQHSSGYDRNVFVYHILARDTIDEIKLKRLETKRSVQELLIEAASRNT